MILSVLGSCRLLRIPPKPPGGAHADWDQAAALLRQTLRQALGELAGVSAQELIEQRYRKFREMGNFFSEGSV